MGQRGLHTCAAVLWHWVWAGRKRLLLLILRWVGADCRCLLLCFGTGLCGTQVLVAMFGRQALAVLLEQPVAERMTQNASLN